MLLSVTDLLLFGGSAALLTSLGGTFLFIFPVTSASSTYWSKWSHAFGFSQPPFLTTTNDGTLMSLKMWAYIVFNLTEAQSGIYLQQTGFFTGAGQGDLKLDPADYGMLGPHAGKLFLGAVAMGGLLKYLGVDFSFNVPLPRL